MKATVVYDSFFGNTEQIAQAIGAALGAPPEVTIRRVGDVKPAEMTGLDLLVVGSPTRRFSASPAVSRLLKTIPNKGLKGVKVAAFDTRITEDELQSGPGILRFFVKLFGYAAEPMAKRLEKKGGKLAASPEGFFVKGTQGPLQDGELERAAAWAKKLTEAG
jgi:flavodoxin